jgi:hypothetical protein
MSRCFQNDGQTDFLARNVQFKRHAADDDPMSYIQALRSQLYTSELQLLERVKLVDMLNAFTRGYRELLDLASTPMPFPLVQMARTFLFLWTFTIPFTLRGVIQEFYVAEFFVFFLTYGFIGLEIVSMNLMFPFCKFFPAVCSHAYLLYVCVCVYFFPNFVSNPHRSGRWSMRFEHCWYERGCSSWNP